jgi:RNA polymerase sigma-70 factor (ECF subfamily)
MSYLREVDLGASFQPFAVLRQHLGYVPRLFRAQTVLPQIIEAEAALAAALVFKAQALSRIQKEQILLAVAAAQRNSYCVAAHHQVLRVLGVPETRLARVISGDAGDFPPAEAALLEFARGLSGDPPSREDVASLLAHGWTDEAVLEAVLTAGFAYFECALAAGLGAKPDFEPPAIPAAAPKKAHPLGQDSRPTVQATRADPDAEQVARVQNGDVDAFEELIQRHSQRVYRTLVGILGNPDEARDGMQDTFLKAFEHLGEFEGRAKFSTWLVSIASNTGIQRLRERRPLESLDDDDADEGFRPRQIQAWTEDPEQLYSQVEMRRLVERSVMALPAKYRTVLVLRDIERLSTEEAAAALGLGISALKARLLRGRLMVREALAPHFGGRPGVTAG